MIKYVCLVCCVSEEEPQSHVISVRPKNSFGLQPISAQEGEEEEEEDEEEPRRG